ncbi:hypothetical protein U9M48_040479, partial [Paspalum notatum var. saurae]
MATAPSSSSFLFLLILLLSVLGMASSTDYNTQPSIQVPLPSLCPCNCPKENETLLHMNLHQLPAWPNVPNPNEVAVITGGPPVGFGQTYVDDWFLTMGTDPNQKIIGRAQGYHIQASQTINSWYFSHIFVLQDDWFAGSTLQVLGIYASESGQWSIVGGTGVFTNAHGTIKFSRSVVGGNEVIYALDIH